MEDFFDDDEEEETPPETDSYEFNITNNVTVYVQGDHAGSEDYFGNFEGYPVYYKYDNSKVESIPAKFGTDSYPVDISKGATLQFMVDISDLSESPSIKYKFSVSDEFETAVSGVWIDVPKETETIYVEINGQSQE